MKDNTFMELSNLCLPNNSDVRKEVIKEKLTHIYKTKYVSENETELAVDQFLVFCSDRTELFVPASGEDCFKFFHRSFFEYFYSQYIFTRMQNAQQVYEAWKQFDVDSEVFELTLAMYKQKNEIKYQEIVEYVLERVNDNSMEEKDRINALNMIILSMQVIDDELYKKKLIDFIEQEREFCIKNIDKIHNQAILLEIIKSKKEYCDRICEKYKSKAILEAIISFTRIFPEAERYIKQKRKSEDRIDDIRLLGYKFKHFYNYNFYSQIYFEQVPIKDVFDNLRINNIDELGKECRMTLKEVNKIKGKYNKYLNIDESIKQQIQCIMFESN